MADNLKMAIRIDRKLRTSQNQKHYQQQKSLQDSLVERNVKDTPVFSRIICLKSNNELLTKIPY